RYAKASGIYSIAGGQMAGCVAQVDQQVWASVLPKPQIIIVGDSIKCSTSASAYQWYMFGVKIPKATSQSFLPDNKGKFKVLITDSIGCVTSSDDFEYTGISNIVCFNGISVYPNPIKAGEPLYIENVNKKIRSNQ
ncbi:MAG: hypothetical protein HYZ42_00180, partial [Bacteroidetes bacterium]|nr:hypothetical protein [Bacteroidota bacterium]